MTKRTPTLKPTIKPESKKITVDFENHPHLWRLIESGPDHYLRTMENMVIYSVKLFYDEEERRCGSQSG